MRQRVAFLRTLLAGRPLLCLDEPFAPLDALTRAQAQTWLAEALAREPRTVLLVTHDVEEAVLLADRVVLLSPRPGRVVLELDVPLPRPRARTDRAVVELRERALAALRGEARDRAAARPRACSIGAWELVVRVGLGRPAAAARADARRAVAVGGPLDPRAGPAATTVGGRRRARRRAGARRRRSRSRCTSCRGRSGAAAARGRLAGRADPGARAADRARSSGSGWRRRS